MRNDQTAWELGGLVTNEGTLDRRLAGQEWRVPEAIELDGDRLVWIWFTSARGPSYVGPGEGLLDGFLKLADGSPTEILTYARRWGVLGICHHGLPSMHLQNPLPLAHAHNQVVNRCYPNEDKQRAEGGWYEEPLSAWRRYARQMEAALNLASELKKNASGKSEDWDALYGEPTARPDPKAGKYHLSGVLNHWVSLGLVRPLFIWTEANPMIQFAFAGVFGALTLQLMLATSSMEGLAICSACKRPYVPTRRPRRNQKNYCRAEECRKNAAQANASQAYFRRRKARKLHEAGTPIKTIADDLGVEVAEIRRWLKKR